MTTTRYSNRFPVSRPEARPARHTRSALHLPSLLAGKVRPPQKDHYGLLDPGDADHPVDVMIDGLPAIARRARRLRRLADEVQRRLADNSLFLRHEDLRLHQQTERERIYYDTGFEHGLLAGGSAASAAFKGQATKRFGNRLQVLLTTTDLPDLTAAGVMLSHVRALISMARPTSSPRASGRARGAVPERTP